MALRGQVRPGLSLHSAQAGSAGQDRINLLEAIRDTGSISAAAKSIGIGFRAAWDGVRVLNNLFSQPLVLAKSGGASGGGAQLTREGEQVIAAYRSMEAELGLAVGRLQHDIATAPGMAAPPMPWVLQLRTSVRNALQGRIVRIVRGAVNAEVQLSVSDSVCLVAIVTNESVRELGLVRGGSAVALISPSGIVLAREGEVGKTSARNQLAAEVVRRRDGAVNSELILSLGNEKSLAAVITKESAQDIDFRRGDRVLALIKASHVILLA